jgi:hypothetical protein
LLDDKLFVLLRAVNRLRAVNWRRAVCWLKAFYLLRAFYLLKAVNSLSPFDGSCSKGGYEKVIEC